MGVANSNQRVFDILRFFSIASLISIFVAAVALAWLYRQVAIGVVINLGEHGNQVMVDSFLDAVRPEIDTYLLDESAHHKHPLPQGLAQAIARFMEDETVIRVNILDDEGIIVFSSLPALIGQSRNDSEAFRTAIAGNVYSRLDARNSIGLFGRRSAAGGVVRSFVPIRPDRASQPEGVFSVETDVREQLYDIEHAQLIVFGGSVGVMALLYIVLLAIVRHADRIIKAQEQTIRERSFALEQLSAQLLMLQEQETKRVAQELHEGVAQTLSGLKFRLEHASHLVEERESNDGQSLASLVPLVQEAIQDVRKLAMDIRPPSLDELGVVATLTWYCREFGAVYPALRLDFEAALSEADVPHALKVVLFRVVQQMLQYLGHETGATQATLRLARAGDVVRLELMDDLDPGTVGGQQASEYALHLVTLRERIALAGGSVETEHPNRLQGTTLRAEWPL